MLLECILNTDFLQNLFMQIQEQVQNLTEFIKVIKHSNSSPYSSVTFMFLLNASSKIDMKRNRKGFRT